MSEKGLVHIYTGNGKGKTTAALGLCLRAAGHGISSMIIQFMKGRETGELKSAEMLNSLITIEQYGSPELLVNNNPELFAEHKDEALRGYTRAMKIMRENSYGILILDEILNLINFRLIDLQAAIALVKSKPEPMELVLTGRGAPDELVRLADLVTEMREIKHYYTEGIPARKGIEF